MFQRRYDLFVNGSHVDPLDDQPFQPHRGRHVDTFLVLGEAFDHPSDADRRYITDETGRLVATWCADRGLWVIE